MAGEKEGERAKIGRCREGGREGRQGKKEFTGESGVQSHAQLHSAFEVFLGCRRCDDTVFKTKENRKREEGS